MALKLWLALKPIQTFHIVVWLVIPGDTSFILASSAGSRGLSFGPKNVKTRWAMPRAKGIEALAAIKMLGVMRVCFSRA